MEESYYLVRGADQYGKKCYLTCNTAIGSIFHNGTCLGFTQFTSMDIAISRMYEIEKAVSVEKVTFTGAVFSKERKSTTKEVARK